MKTGNDICFIPPISYHFFPKEQEYISELLGKPVRRIFSCNESKYSENERNKLKEIYEHIGKVGYVLPSYYKAADVLRQLQGTDYNIELTFQNIKNEIGWKQQYLPVQLNDKTMDILNTGFIYVHGRDNRFRPLLFMNPAKYDKSKYTFESWLEAIIFLIEFLLGKCILPGQFENWNIIVDLRDLTLNNIPFDLKFIFSAIKGAYRCRLYKLYILSLTSVFTFAWNIAKGTLGSTIESKSHLIEENEGRYDDLFKEINKNQVEQKFGGSARNLETNEYFPFKFYSEDVFLDNEDDNNIKHNLEQHALETYEYNNEIFYPALSEDE